MWRKRNNYKQKVNRRQVYSHNTLKKLTFEIFRMWTRQLFSYNSRKSQAANDHLIAEMRLANTYLYKNYLQMGPILFDELLSIVGPMLNKVDIRREPISAAARLALTLR